MEECLEIKNSKFYQDFKLFFKFWSRIFGERKFWLIKKIHIFFTIIRFIQNDVVSSLSAGRMTAYNVGIGNIKVLRAFFLFFWKDWRICSRQNLSYCEANWIWFTLGGDTVGNFCGVPAHFKILERSKL